MTVATAYSHETVQLDGEYFSDSEFRDCRLVYSGGKPPVFDGCKFHGCEWKFEGPAANTLAHMRVVWAAGGKAPVQAMIKEITAAVG